MATQYVYVSPRGSHLNSGDRNSPLKNPHHALQLSRTIKAAGNNPVIRLMSGYHCLSDTLKLRQIDSGLVIEADPLATQRPVISAGRPIGPWFPAPDGSAYRVTKIPPEQYKFRSLFNRLSWLVPFTFPGNQAASIKRAQIFRDPDSPYLEWYNRYHSVTFRINGTTTTPQSFPVVPENVYVLYRVSTSPLKYVYSDSNITLEYVIANPNDSNGTYFRATSADGLHYWEICPAMSTFEHLGQWVIPTVNGMPGVPGTKNGTPGFVPAAFVYLFTWDQSDDAPYSAEASLWPPFNNLPDIFNGTHDFKIKHVWSTSSGRGRAEDNKISIPKGVWYTSRLDHTIIFSRTKSLKDIVIHIGDGVPDVVASGSWGLELETNLLWADCNNGDNVPPSQNTMYVPCIETAISISGDRNERVNNITLRNFIIAHAGWNYPDNGCAGIQASNNTNAGTFYPSFDTPSAVYLAWASNCTLDYVGVHCCESTAIGIGPGCLNTLITYNDVYNVGGSGIVVGQREYTPRIDSDWKILSDAPSGTTISDCTIDNAGLLDWGACGIVVHFAANTNIEYNEIKNLYYTAISIGFNWQGVINSTANTRCYNNHIHHVLTALADGGGIYTVGPQAWTDAQWNYIHDIVVSVGAIDTVGVGLYLDQTSAGVRFKNNYIQRIPWYEKIHWNQTRPEDNDVEDPTVLSDNAPAPTNFVYGPR
jgi:hypothetical protein